MKTYELMERGWYKTARGTIEPNECRCEYHHGSCGCPECRTGKTMRGQWSARNCPLHREHER